MILFSVQLYVTYHAESGDVGVGKNDITSILLFCCVFLFSFASQYVVCFLWTIVLQDFLVHVNVLIAFIN